MQMKEFLNIIGFCIIFCVETSKKYFVLCIVLNALGVIMPFAVIYLTSAMVNVLAESLLSTDATALNIAGYSFLAIALSLFVVNFLMKLFNSLKLYFQGLYEEIMQKNGQVKLMEKTAGIDLSYFDSYEFYDEVRDTNANTPLLIQTVFSSIDFIRNAASFLIAFIYLAQFNIFYAVVLFLSVIPSFYFQNKQIQAIYSFQREHMREERKMYYNMDVVINRRYAKDLRIYGMFPMIYEKFQSTWKILFENKKRIIKRYTKLLSVFSLFPEAVSVLIIIHLGWMILQKQSTLGDFTY